MIRSHAPQEKKRQANVAKYLVNGFLGLDDCVEVDASFIGARRVLFGSGGYFLGGHLVLRWRDSDESK